MKYKDNQLIETEGKKRKKGHKKNAKFAIQFNVLSNRRVKKFFYLFI